MDAEDAQVLGDGRYLELRCRRGWEFAHRRIGRSVVAVIAVDPEDRIVLVEQFRPAVESNVIELPAGLVGDEPEAPNENALEAARRELAEETGFEADSWTRLPTVVSSAGLTDERVELFLARDLHRVGTGGGTDAEDISVHRVPLATLIAWLAVKIDDGCLVDGRVYAAPTLLADLPVEQDAGDR